MNGSRADVIRHLTCTCGMPEAEAEKLIPKGAGTTRDARVALSPEQLRDFERAVRREIIDEPMKALLLLTPRTGLRVAEITGLTTCDVVIEGGRIGLRFFGKGQKERFVPLTRAAQRILQQYMAVARRQAGVFLFPNTRGTNRISSAAVQKACHTLVEREPTLRGLTPHVLRHTYATEALRNCADLMRTAKNLGHGRENARKVPTVTLVYLHPGHAR